MLFMFILFKKGNTPEYTTMKTNAPCTKNNVNNSLIKFF